jgi:AcrR family transcriptional regulator
LQHVQHADRPRSLERAQPQSQTVFPELRITTMPESVLRPAAEATPARTAEVFRAAAELMVEKGYGGTSIGDIAQAVGMTKAGLYHHISGKQDMLYQILNHAMDVLNRIVATPVRLIEDPEERLRLLMRLNIQGQVKHGLAFTVLFSEINHLAPAQQEEIRGRIKEHHALIRETLRELADSRRLRSLDVNIATMHIMNAITGISRWKHQDFTSDEEHLIRETVDYTMAALLKSVR